MPKSEIRFDNIDAWSAKLKDPKMIGIPIRKALQRTGVYAAGQTRDRTPVDTGRLRGSITSDVDNSPIPKFATIGSNISYARPVEEGSGPHFPPLSALQPWAARHGFPAGSAGAFLVARAIAQRGTKGHKMLEKGIAASKAFFRQQLRLAARDIERSWSRLR